MDPESTQPSLLSRVRNPADREAWHEFESRYGDLIVGYARRCGLQLSDAEDVRQMVLINLARALPGFRYERDRGRFRSYLGKAVRSAVLRQKLRHNQGPNTLSTHVIEDLAEPSAADSHDAVWEREWVDHHCRLAMDALRRSFNPQTLVVFEQLLAGRGVKEIAEMCDLSQAAVRQAKQRVKQRLRAIVSQQLEDENSTDA